jgi:hypothetical protein
VFGRFVFLRLRNALLPDFERRWKRDIDGALADVHRTLAAVNAELTELRAFRRQVVLDEWRARTMPLVEEVERLDLVAVRAHVTAAIAAAELVSQPFAHLVVEDVLPPEVYALLRTAIPPADLFSERDPVKRDFEMSGLDAAPPLTARMWRRFDEEIVGGLLTPMLLARFREAIVAHYAGIGGREFGEAAAAIPHRTFAGRLQLRRPGYQLKPHRDPRRVAVTGLCYFPRQGDGDGYGTQLFTVDRPVTAPGLSTFFPESAGARCELVRTVPYRANSMLVRSSTPAAPMAPACLPTPLFRNGTPISST